MTEQAIVHEGVRMIPLELWCEREGILPSNARGFYLPRQRIPGAIKLLTDWYVPESSALIRKR